MVCDSFRSFVTTSPAAANRPNDLILVCTSLCISYYNLSLTDVRTSSSRPFTGRPGPNLVRRWRTYAEMGLSHWFPWKLNRCHVIQQKLRYGFNNGRMVTAFGISRLPGHINSSAKNERKVHSNVLGNHTSSSE